MAHKNARRCQTEITSSSEATSVLRRHHNGSLVQIVPSLLVMRWQTVATFPSTRVSLLIRSSRLGALPCLLMQLLRALVKRIALIIVFLAISIALRT